MSGTIDISDRYGQVLSGVAFVALMDRAARYVESGIGLEAMQRATASRILAINHVEPPARIEVVRAMQRATRETIESLDREEAPNGPRDRVHEDCQELIRISAIELYRDIEDGFEAEFGTDLPPLGILRTPSLVEWDPERCAERKPVMVVVPGARRVEVSEQDLLDLIAYARRNVEHDRFATEWLDSSKANRQLRLDQLSSDRGRSIGRAVRNAAVALRDEQRQRALLRGSTIDALAILVKRLDDAYA